MDARGHKRAVCATLAQVARAEAEAIGAGSGRYFTGDDRGRAIAAYGEVAAEMERRGAVVHRAPDPTAERPALPFPDAIERVEATSPPENG